MRIIGGEFRSRRLLTPKDETVTRPIPDRVKESLFGLLRGHTEGAAVFDCFAGTGALGLEAISRGATRCVFVERDRGIAEILKKNIEALGVGDRAELVVGDALGPGAVARCPRPVKLAFFDPPYPLVRDVLGWKRVRAQVERVLDLLAPDGFLMLRTPHPFTLEVRDEADAPESTGRKTHDRPWMRRGKEQREGRRREHWAETTESEPPPPVQEVPAGRTKHIPGDLTFANGVGPETHVYHSTAVHLYMRKPAEGGPGAGPAA